MIMMVQKSPRQIKNHPVLKRDDATMMTTRKRIAVLLVSSAVIVNLRYSPVSLTPSLRDTTPYQEGKVTAWDLELLSDKDGSVWESMHEDTLSYNGHDWSPPQPAVIPLLDWELASAGSKSDRVCKPPDGIPNECCLGSHSNGGGVHFFPAKCNHDATVHARIANYTQHYLSTTGHHRMLLSSTRRNMTQQQRRRERERHYSRQLQQLEASSTDSPPRQDCDACRIVDYLLQQNWTLAIQGDSMSRQTFTGLECELRRRGYVVQSTATKGPPRGSRWRYGITDIGTLQVSRPPPSPDTGAGIPYPMHTHTATIRYYAIYRPIEDNVEIFDIVQQSDILVFDHGLHWRPPGEMQAYEDSMVGLLDAYKRTPLQPLMKDIVKEGGDGSANSTDADKGGSLHRLQLVAWRQTSSQHYNSSGGHFQAKLTEGCVPMYGDMVGPRLARMVAAASRAGFTTLNPLDRDFLSRPSAEDELVVLPYRDYTNSVHYLHPGECSHFCHDPHLWLPIWHTLRIAMDRTFRLLELEKERP